MVQRIDGVRPDTTTRQETSTMQDVVQRPLMPADDKPPPRIITTKPTLLAMPPRSADVSPTQTPPPEHPFIHHAAEFLPTPGPAFPTPKPSAIKHHNPFSFLNPWRRHHIAPTIPVSPSSPYPQAPASPVFSTPPPHHPTPTASNSPTPLPRVRPADESPPATTPQPISSLPNPYHHAPQTPLDAAYAAYPDPKVRERQKVIREAMRMERERTKEKGPKAVQDVASVVSQGERDARRKRSLGLGLRRDGKGVTDEWKRKGANS